jgi:hypothetical protein
MEKQQEEVNNFSRLTNGDLKRVLFEEYGTSTQQPEQLKYIADSEILQLKLTARNDFLKQIQQLEGTSGEGGKMGIESAQEDMNSYLERLGSHFGVRMFVAMGEYQCRQGWLREGQAEPVWQHFEFVLVLVYKLCVPTFMKKELEENIFNDFKRNHKLNSVRSALQKGSADEETVGLINELRHSFLDRTTFGPLYDFVTVSVPRYQGVTLNTYVNTNLYFQDPDRHEEQLWALSQHFLSQMNELYLLADYFEVLVDRGSLRGEKVAARVSTLKEVVALLVLYYFTTYFESCLQRWYGQVVPLFLNVKFEVKRLNDFKGSLKEYKQRLAELFGRFSVERFSRQTCFHNLLMNKQTEYFFKFVIDLFSRIDKVNDNGREILRQEANELARIGGTEGKQEEWEGLLGKYLELGRERSDRVLLERA